MRNVDHHLLEDKMEEAVTHYINTHPQSEPVHVDANGLALNVQDDGGGRVVTIMHPQSFQPQMCRQVSVGDQVTEGGQWGEELLDPESRLAALVAQIAQHSRASHHHKVSARDVDSAVMLDAPLRMFNGHPLDPQESIIVEVPGLPRLPPLQDMKRCPETDWFDKDKQSLKNNPILTDSDGPVLELNAGASPAQNKQSKKSLPHKKRISRKLKRNTGSSTPQQDLVVINCAEDVPQEEILPDNFVTSVHHQEPLPNDPHHLTHELRPLLICQLCGEFFGTEQFKFYQHLRQHYEPHNIIIENSVPDLAIDKITNTCIVDNVANLPDSIVELTLEGTVPKTMYQPIEKHILYTSSDKTLNYANNKVQYSMAPSMPSEVEKADLYDSLDKIEVYGCVKCNKSFRSKKQCEAHIKETHVSKQIDEISEFSEPEDLMEGIHVTVDDNEQYLPHLTVESGHVSQDHHRHWYLVRNGGPGAECAAESAYSLAAHASQPAHSLAAHAAPPAHAAHAAHAPQATQAAHSQQMLSREEVLQKMFESSVPTEAGNFTENIQDHEIIDPAPERDPDPDTELEREPEQKEEKPEVELTNNGDSEGKKKGKQYPCVVCGRVFSFRNSLFYHALSHAAPQHTCATCHKAFYTLTALKIHKRTHSDDRPYPCEKCDKNFRQWSDLSYHNLSIHSNQKNFKCEFCNKEFARKYSLNVHRRIHTGEKNYKCEYCNKSFRASSYRTSHMRTHTGDKPYKCDICGKCFRVGGDMRRHKRIHEKKKWSDVQRNDKLVPKREDIKLIEQKEPPKERDKKPKKVLNKNTPKKSPTQKPVKKNQLSKKSAPNVTVQNTKLDGEYKFTSNDAYPPHVEEFESDLKFHNKFKEVYNEEPELNYKLNHYKEQIVTDIDKNERGYAVLKPMFRNEQIIDDKQVYNREITNTDGKLTVFTHIEKKDYNGTIIANTQNIVGDMRQLEREVSRDVRQETGSEVIENGFLERLTALYNIPAV